MVGRIIMFTLLATISLHSREFVEAKNIILPEYRYHQTNVYYPNNKAILDDYTQDEGDKYNDDKTESSDVVDEMSSRRLFEWFSILFQTTTELIQSTPSTESSYGRDLKERIFFKELHRNLTDALQKITEIQRRVSGIVKQREAYTYLSKNKPIVRLPNSNDYRKRFKRDETAKVKSLEVNDIVNKSNTNNTDNVTDNANVTENHCGNNTSGRRSASDIATTEIKNKLLLYLEESFQEIENKIASLKTVKQAFMDNESFRIGYIIANIDTLEMNIMSLKRNVDNSKMFWEDKKILELYDTLKVSNQAVSGLIESLKMSILRSV